MEKLTVREAVARGQEVGEEKNVEKRGHSVLVCKTYESNFYRVFRIYIYLYVKLAVDRPPEYLRELFRGFSRRRRSKITDL